MWGKNVRWQGNPGQRLMWDEIVEHKSIACGEDMFCFMRQLGTILGKERFPEAFFLGRKMRLPPVSLIIERAGPARSEAIGDYRNP